MVDLRESTREVLSRARERSWARFAADVELESMGC
jgi:hypothetical protein